MSDVSMNDMWKKWYGPPVVVLFIVISWAVLGTQKIIRKLIPKTK